MNAGAGGRCARREDEPAIGAEEQPQTETFMLERQAADEELLWPGGRCAAAAARVVGALREGQDGKEVWWSECEGRGSVCCLTFAK